MHYRKMQSDSVHIDSAYVREKDEKSENKNNKTNKKEISFVKITYIYDLL